MHWSQVLGFYDSMAGSHETKAQDQSCQWTNGNLWKRLDPGQSSAPAGLAWLSTTSLSSSLGSLSRESCWIRRCQTSEACNDSIPWNTHYSGICVCLVPESLSEHGTNGTRQAFRATGHQQLLSFSHRPWRLRFARFPFAISQVTRSLTFTAVQGQFDEGAQHVFALYNHF